MIKKLKVDRNLCIGAASCVAIYPEVFQLDEENKAVMPKKGNGKTSDELDVTELDVSEVNDESLLLGAQSCPTKAIFLYDETGAQVYPEA